MPWVPPLLAALVFLTTFVGVLALRRKNLKFGLLLTAAMGVLLGAIGFRDPAAALFFGVALPIVAYILRQSSGTGRIVGGADSGGGVSSSGNDYSSNDSSSSSSNNSGSSSSGGGDFGGGGASGKW